MPSQQQFFTLNNGNKIPAVAIIGTGTRWFKRGDNADTLSEDLVSQIKYALKLPGVIHVDAAEMYRTYPELSEALKQSDKPRKEIFITDKFSTTIKVTDSPKIGLETSLKRLNLDYVDLYLLHSPLIDPSKFNLTLEEAWREMEALYKSGLAKNIGVSNFAIADLKRIMKIAEIQPQVNQIEYNAHLQNQTPGIYKFCQDNDILLEAYSPLGPLQKKPDNYESIPLYQYIDELAQKYNKTNAQILLRWVSKRNVLPVTTSSDPKRIKAAQEIYDFDLSQDEVDHIKKLGLDRPACRMYWKPEYDQFNSQSQKE